MGTHHWLPAVAAIALAATAAPVAAAEDDPGLEEGRALYQQHCASCHGAGLEGQDDWQSRNPDGTLKAPPHDDTGHTWHHGDGLLTDYVRLGGAATLAARGIEGVQSAMPAFGDVMSDAEIDAVLAYIRSHWSQRARTYQEGVSEAERESGQD